MSQLTLIRGMSGSGKTSLARSLASASMRQGKAAVCFAADDWMTVDGVYSFDPTRLAEAHHLCLKATEAALREGYHVIVHNTFRSRMELRPYTDLLPSVRIIDLFDGGCTDEELVKRSTHGVPITTIRDHRARWES